MRAGGGRRGKLTASRRLRDWYRLAEALGRPVAEVRREVSEREFGHWRAKFAREPLLVEWVDYWGARIFALLFNAHRDPDKTEPLDPEAVTPDPWGERAAAANAGPAPARFRGKDLGTMFRALAGVGD